MNDFFEIASKYVESMEKVYPGYKLVIEDHKEFISKYYFDFVFQPVDEKVSNKKPIVGGACGFAIDKKTKKIEILSFGDLSLLEAREKEVHHIYKILSKIEGSSNKIGLVKSKYSLNSLRILQIKKIINNTNLLKEERLDKLFELLTELKNRN